MFLRSKQPRRRGQALVEYGILLGGIALLSLVAVSLIGHKTSDMLGAVGTILPGAHADDNGAYVSGKLVETTQGANGAIVLDVAAVTAGGPRLGNNLGVDLTNLILEP